METRCREGDSTEPGFPGENGLAGFIGFLGSDSRR
jgi:hypothetical protein